ncbi:unnamed protein product, partial [Ectocarpus sp. 12 AP-2014]
MTAKTGRSLCLLAFFLFEAARALSGGGSGPGGFPAQHHSGGYGTAQQHQQHLQRQEKQQQPHQHQQHPHYQQQQQQQQYMTTTPSSSPADTDDPDDPSKQGPPPLPAGWGELRTGDGRPYYVYYPTGAVQWERPKPPAADSDGSDEAGQQREEGSSAATAEGATAAGGAAAVGGEAGARGEAGKGGAVAGYGEEDPYRGESEMSDAEREIDTATSGARSSVIGDADSPAAGGGAQAPPSTYPGQTSPMDSRHVLQGAAGKEGTATAGAPAYPSSARPEGNEGRPPSPDDPFRQQQGSGPGGVAEGNAAAPASQQGSPWGGGAGGGGGGDGDKAAASPLSGERVGQEGSGVGGERPDPWGMGGDRQALSQPQQPSGTPPNPFVQADQNPRPAWGEDRGEASAGGESPTAPTASSVDPMRGSTRDQPGGRNEHGSPLLDPWSASPHQQQGAPPGAEPYGRRPAGGSPAQQHPGYNQHQPGDEAAEGQSWGGGGTEGGGRGGQPATASAGASSSGPGQGGP